MSMILDFIVNYGDIIIVAFSAGGIGWFTMPILKAKIKKDGFQVSDISEAVCEGTVEYQKAFENIDSVIDDVTVNDTDTINFIKNTIKTFKTFK